MITIEEALKIIKEETKIIGLERVDIISSLNRVLAEDIYSKDILPPFDKSAMDGYAIKFEDTTVCESAINAELDIVGLIRAGEYYEDELKQGQAIKIMTGAPVPKSANAVIQIEKVECKENKLIISDVVKKDTNIIKMGEEINVGDLAIPKGKVIRPTEIGFLASLGYSKVLTYKTPKIAIISTGDELLNIDEVLEKGKIRNSNEYSLMALCKNLDLEFISLGIASDKKEVLKGKITEGLESADIVITSGGVSAGDFDFVEDVLEEIGAKINFTSVAIKPGKPVTFATVKDKFFFGLPGNPLSLITTFEEFVKPAIKNISGFNKIEDDMISVLAASKFKARNNRRKYIYVNITEKEGIYYANDLGNQCSNHLMTMSKANGIIIMNEDVREINVGDKVYGKFIFK
ncbi:molybdopterin molybdotransferase MoeA [Clostridium senegalense]|uniref:Molybdopterin molybdenumtransferase n=1 Tax=Clostridium senegalense TaxID=1465809 RepID=A0A6M0H5Z6_9CLOT|nr:gephyrin-like molybdotransferase Glp [Clostridium senegalense]NEU05738.1 molybdopterin molybdotransferase MoeA [Clostridium senegalense]